jgi:adenylate cyclase
MTATRRLAAILTADVVGYSRLMGADEEGTLAALRAVRRELGDPKTAEHRGRIVKTTGDGLLVEFASVVDAVRCAVEVQREMIARNAATPAERRIEFRMGINVGDIIIEDGDIFGDGVNIAARLEALAEPGGICLSAAAHEQVRDRLDLVFDDLGEQQVKNITRPVRTYGIVLGASPRAALPVGTALPLPDKPSLAVLPFQNLTGDAEQEYFVDGMVEEITTAIARLPWLFVIARNSAFTYKGSGRCEAGGAGIGRALRVEGSVRKAGNRVRITGQLIDTTTGAHIWADRFDGALDDIFELQDQVASNVAGAIEPKLRQTEIERASRKPTANLTAYDLYLRALAQSYRFTEEGVAEAVVLTRQALAIDPSYAPAAAMVGWCRALQRVQGWGALSDEDIGEACRLARQALEAERDDAETIWQAVWTLFYLAGGAAMAAAALDRALALNPNAAHAWLARGIIHAVRNQPEAAIEAIERARRLSPFDPYTFRFAHTIAFAHLAARRFEQAIEWADRALHDQPRMVNAMRTKVVANAHLGHLDAARAELSRVLAIYPTLTIVRFREFAHFLAPEVLEVLVTGLRWPACRSSEQEYSRYPEGLFGSKQVSWMAPLCPLLLAVEAQSLHQRGVAEAEQEGRAVATVDVLVEGPGRHREHVFVFPVQPPAAHDRVAGALDHVIVRAADAPGSPCLLAGTHQLHVAGDGRHHRAAGPPVGVFEDDPIGCVGGTHGSQPLQGGPHLRHRVVPRRRIDGRTEGLPLLVVLLVETSFEHPHQRGIQAVQPDHRRIGVVGVVVP